MNNAVKLQKINKQIDDQINKLLQSNKLFNTSFYKTLNNTVILYYNLVENFGFNLVNEVILGTREKMMNDAINSDNQMETIPTTFYVLLLIGIILFFKFKESVERNKNMIPILSEILFNILEENAITGIIYLISKRDFENLQQSTRFSVYKFSGYNSENIVNSVLIVNKINNKKYQTAVMPYGMLTQLKTLLGPTLPKSDILSDFVRKQDIYSISNTGVLSYLKHKLKSLESSKSHEEPNGRPAKRPRFVEGGKRKTRKRNTKGRNTKGRNTKGRNTKGRNTKGRNTKGRNTKGRNHTSK